LRVERVKTLANERAESLEDDRFTAMQSVYWKIHDAVQK
jgi:hypothetical protein